MSSLHSLSSANGLFDVFLQALRPNTTGWASDWEGYPVNKLDDMEIVSRWSGSKAGKGGKGSKSKAGKNHKAYKDEMLDDDGYGKSPSHDLHYQTWKDDGYVEEPYDQWGDDGYKDDYDKKWGDDGYDIPPNDGKVWNNDGYKQGKAGKSKAGNVNDDSLMWKDDGQQEEWHNDGFGYHHIEWHDGAHEDDDHYLQWGDDGYDMEDDTQGEWQPDGYMVGKAGKSG